MLNITVSNRCAALEDEVMDLVELVERYKESKLDPEIKNREIRSARNRIDTLRRRIRQVL